MERAHDIEAALRRLVPLIKLGSYPDSCIMGNPYCECRKGSVCRLLPDDDELGEDAAKLLGGEE